MQSQTLNLPRKTNNNIVIKQKGASQCNTVDNEEEDEEDEQSEDDVLSSPETLDESPTKLKERKIEGIIPKDIEQKKEMMSFIAYSQHIENTCKLITSSKAISLCDSMDKNRIYLSGTSIMSTKLTVSLANCNKICN